MNRHLLLVCAVLGMGSRCLGPDDCSADPNRAECCWSEDGCDSPGGGACAPDAGPVDHDRALWLTPRDSPRNSDYLVDTHHGTVLDRVTDLMWQREVIDAGFTSTAAQAFCDGLSLAGFDDWRLPSAIELETIVDHGPATPPLIDSAAFPGLTGDLEAYFWSATPYFANATEAWQTSYWLGYSNAGHDFNAFSARCVRSAVVRCAPSPYVVGAQTVFDPGTGLTWQRDGTATATFTEAQAACAPLTLGGHHARLPTVKELETLIDFHAFNPALDPTFTGASDWYWSSTPLAAVPTSHWMVSFYDGTVAAPGFATNHLRCVSGPN